MAKMARLLQSWVDAALAPFMAPHEVSQLAPFQLAQFEMAVHAVGGTDGRCLVPAWCC